MKKAIVTVIGGDKKGIIAGVSARLSQCGANILDISQTVMDTYFVMVMLVDVDGATMPFAELKQSLEDLGSEMALSIRIQHEDIFNSMHRI